MKVLKACEILDGVGAAAKALGAKPRAKVLAKCSKALQRFGGRDLIDVRAVPGSLVASSGSRQSEIGQICGSLNGASVFIRALGDEERANDVSNLFTIMNESSGAMIREYIAALESAFGLGAPVPDPDENVVEMYVRLLKGATHDADEFPRVFSHLENDNRLARPEIVAVASAFAFRMAKSTTRKEALERIWSIHQASASMDAKSRAMKGKSAA